MTSAPTGGCSARSPAGTWNEDLRSRGVDQTGATSRRLHSRVSGGARHSNALLLCESVVEFATAMRYYYTSQGSRRRRCAAPWILLCWCNVSPSGGLEYPEQSRYLRTERRRCSRCKRWHWGRLGIHVTVSLWTCTYLSRQRSDDD